jgi:trk system potassium uptake protein
VVQTQVNPSSRGHDSNYVIVVGGGRVGFYLAKELLEQGYEVLVIENDEMGPRAGYIADQLGSAVIKGDGCEAAVLEEAGTARAAMLIAVTGDDEDNLVIGQVAREKYGVDKVIARVNDPRNQPLFDLLGLQQTISATRMVLGLIEHEVPEHELVHLLELRKENLEIVEVEIEEGAPCAGKRVEQLSLPESARLISVMRDGKAEIAVGSTELLPGDQVLAVLQPGKEEELRRLLLKSS